MPANPRRLVLVWISTVALAIGLAGLVGMLTPGPRWLHFLEGMCIGSVAMGLFAMVATR